MGFGPWRFDSSRPHCVDGALRRQTEWYESFAASELFAEARTAAVRLLGRGPGRCLDLGCGTGTGNPAAAGGRLVGDRRRCLGRPARRRRARGRTAGRALVRADAHRLPFETPHSTPSSRSSRTPTSTISGVASREAAPRAPARRRDSSTSGVHPCFGLPAVERRDGEPALLHPEYRPHGLADRVAELLGDRDQVAGRDQPPAAGRLPEHVLAAGFTLEAFDEPGELDPPLFLAVRGDVTARAGR